MEVISKEMQRLLATGSTLRAMFEEGKRMVKQYGAENVFDFSLGNPSVPTPAAMNESMINVINNTDSMMLHGYMSNAGYESSRQAVADDLNRRFGTHFAAKNVTMTVGAANALVIAIKILTNPEDEVIVFAPFFLEYRNYISNFGAKTVVVPPNPPTFSMRLALPPLAWLAMRFRCFSRVSRLSPPSLAFSDSVRSAMF